MALLTKTNAGGGFGHRYLGDLPWPALVLCTVLCVYGIWWGSTEIWNADSVLFENQFREGAWPFSPFRFDKPPLLSYISFFFALVPRQLIVKAAEFITGNSYPYQLDFISVWLGKLLHLLFACGTVYLLWRIVRRFASDAVAGASALFLASSAGFIVQAHLITTDLPLLFFTLLALFACQRLWDHNRMRDYVIAGLSIGLMGAIKYNGLVIGLALPVFHLLRPSGAGLLQRILDRRFFVALLCVPGGFLLGNPYAAIEFRRFISDVYYLFSIAPDYVGANDLLAGQADLLETVATDLVGWPMFVFLAVGLPVAVIRIFRAKRSCEQATLAAAVPTGVIYISYFYMQTNVQVRWLLVLVPLGLIIAAPMWELLAQRAKPAFKVAAGALIVYGTVCSLYVGYRFTADPRFDAVDWVKTEAPPGSVIESSSYVPQWYKHWGVQAKWKRMPTVTGRRRVLEEQLEDRPELLSVMHSREHDDLAWYTMSALKKRHPDFIAVSSLYFDRFMGGTVAEHYPEMKAYFTDLLSGKAGYDVVFDERCCSAIPLLYPKEILFVDNRLVILRRSKRP